MSNDRSKHPEVDGARSGDSALLDEPLRGSREVIRFGATERAFHWAFAIPFLGLLLSGLPLSFPVLRSWINGYSPQVGLRLHLVSGVAWILAPALVVVLGDRRALAAAGSNLFAIVGEELWWLRQLPRMLAGLPCEMTGVGRFNAGQKLNAVFVAITSVLFLITGVILWMVWQWPGSVSEGEPLGRALIGWSRRLHYLSTMLVLAPLLGHIVLATVHPRTKESLRGMLFGMVDAEWARQHHPRWYAEACQGPSGPGESVVSEAQSSSLPTLSSER